MSAREEAVMGTAMRFITALGGVVLIGFALGLFGYPIIETIAEPEYADFPGGAAGIVVMLLVMGSVPFGGGVLLIRHAARRGPRVQPITGKLGRRSTSIMPVAPRPVADVVASAATIESSMDAAVLPQPRRRTWLAMLGLAIATVVFVVDALVVSGAFIDGSLLQGTNVLILVFFVLLSAIPLVGGLRLAHAGDPEMGRRFISDVGANAGHLRRPIGLVRTSAGLALVTALVSVPAMIIRRDAAPSIGPFALTIFSLIDPLANIRQRSWWVGALVSAASWFVLFVVTAATTDIVSDQPDVQIGFIVPLMAYPAAITLSALIRFLQWLGRH
jgi:hypothetical protein